jgi:hypothetical protein
VNDPLAPARGFSGKLCGNPLAWRLTDMGWSDRIALKAWLARMRTNMAPIVDAGWVP